MLGVNKFEVPKKFIDAIKEWNEQPDKQNALYDKRVVCALLLMCVSSCDMVAHNIKDEVKVFINGTYKILSISFSQFFIHLIYISLFDFLGFLKARVGNETARLEYIDQYIEEFCNQKRDAANNLMPTT